MSFKDKVVLVTGSCGGIGATIVKQFAKEGACVVIVDRSDENLKDVQENCDKYGQKSLVLKADMTDDVDIKRIIHETVEKLGRIDVLVNNVGTAGYVDVLSDNFMEIYDKVMNLNLRGAVFLTHLAIPYLIKSKGNIVNISSVAGIRTLGRLHKIPYCVSKAALNHFTRSTAMNLASYGIRVNTISPGPVRTDFIDTKESVTWEQLGAMTALKRVSDSEEIADLVLFLASDKGKGITGSDFVLDNGYSIVS